MAVRSKSTGGDTRGEKPTTAATGLAIWRDLKARGGLDLRRARKEHVAGYDVPLENQLRSILFPGKLGGLDANLRRDPKRSEEFLAAFFAALRPFSMMMADVLAFFETANARYGDRNLKVVFNFTKGAELGLDLEHFRETEQYLRRVTRSVSVWAWSPSIMWNVNNAFRDSLPSPYGLNPQSSSIREWVERHGRPDWLDLPSLPRSGVPALDVLLDRCSELLTDYVAACRSLAPNRPGLRDVSYEAGEIARADDDPTKLAQAQYIYSIYQPDTDNWAQNLAKEAALAGEFVRSQTGADQMKVANDLIGPVKSAVDALYVSSKAVETWEQNYRDILNLPIWKRRHEVYAVWVGAQIAAALNGLDCEFHVEDGVLRFPFSGAQLATIWSKSRDIYMFWTELRSRLAMTARSGRKSIQPDYRILKLPFEPVRGTVLVVECKQYRHSSTRNFAAALNDYAVGCPNAQVVLVNNGPIGDAVMTAVGPPHRARTRALANLRPDESANVAAFENIVRKAVIGDDELSENTTCTDENRLVALIWGKDTKFQDLDLHVIVRDRRSGVATAVDFASRGILSAYPWAQLSADVQSPPGIETIHVAKWLDAIYEVYVHNYSDAACPKEYGVQLYVRAGPQGKDVPFLPISSGEDGRCWFVCRIDGTSGQVDRVNQLLAQVPRIAVQAK